MQKAVVTGAAGFVGSSIVDRLLDDGLLVTGIDSLSDYYPTKLKRSNLENATQNPRFSFVNLPLTDEIDEYLDGASYVFHQAGQPGVRPSWGSSFDSYTRDNVLATQRLLEAVKRSAPSARLVYASSSSVYGDAERYPTMETDLPQPMSPYGVTKLAAEHLVTLYAKNHDLNCVSLRYFTVYGPRQRPDMAFTRFLTRALCSLPIKVYGDGTQVRDFTYIADIVQANIAASAPDTGQPGTIYNVSGGSSVSVNEVLSLIERLVEKDLHVERVPRAVGDVLRTGGSSDLARDVFGWIPQTPLETGLRRQLDWLRDRAEDYLPLVIGA